MLSIPKLASTIWPEFPNVTIVRGDLLHPIISGNKLYKLLPIIEKAKSESFQTLISVGGRYSNHLHALAWASREAGLQSIGLVRGYAEQELTPTLEDCIEWGMKIHFISHREYQCRYDKLFWDNWLECYSSSMRIDEGGWGEEAIKGSSMWWEGIGRDINCVITAIGSGSTYAGLQLSRPLGVDVIGVPVYRDADNYRSLINKFLSVGLEEESIKLWTGYSGRGFGKLNSQQTSFKSTFEEALHIELDPVYTTKTFYALACMLKNVPSLNQKKIAIVHTGGLQGNRSITN